MRALKYGTCHEGHATLLFSENDLAHIFPSWPLRASKTNKYVITITCLHTLLLSSHRPPFLARKFKCVPKPLLLLQAYLLGCSFNSFDKSWNARSYIVILIGVAWILPLFVISQRYCCIIYSVRNNIFVTANASAEEERARKVMQHNTYISLDFPV